MGRQSRCSDCKELKYAYDFGRPGKYCTGPSRSDNEQADLAEVEELTNIESTPLPTNMELPLLLIRCCTLWPNR